MTSNISAPFKDTEEQSDKDNTAKALIVICVNNRMCYV